MTFAQLDRLPAPSRASSATTLHGYRLACGPIRGPRSDLGFYLTPSHVGSRRIMMCGGTQTEQVPA